ncbi:oxidoreductase [Bacteroidia bacterium]|nr:oxidoreductase [Bacteroidia bacterium]
MNKVRIGIIGTGVGIRTHLSGFRSIEQAEVVAIVGSSLARSQEFATKHNIPFACANYKELCNRSDVDLVCITTPNRLHKKEVEYAIKQGKHLICEKPLSDNIEEVSELISLTNGYKKIAIVDHQLRYNPYIQKIKELIENGVLGKVYTIKLNQQGTGFANPNASWNWSFEGESGGGVRLAMASHFTDLIQYWFNSPSIISVQGFLNPITKSRIDNKGNIRNVNACTVCNAQINFANELSAQYTINAGSYSGSRFDIQIFGDNGELTFSLQDKLELYLRSSIGSKQIVDVSNVFQDEKENKISIFSGSFRYFAPLIIEAILSGNYDPIKLSANFIDAKYNVSLLNAIKESANCVKIVTLSKDKENCNDYV